MSQRTHGPAGSVTADRAGRRAEPGLRVLRDDPELDGVPAHRDVVLPQPQRLARRDPRLLGDQVDAGDQLGDRVLDLDAGVHLDEEVLTGLVVDEELDGAALV